MKTFPPLLLFLFSCCIFLPSAFPQGNLTPPGAPAPTMKTLDQVEPRIPIDATHTPGDGTSAFVITQPGSYYLTGNINVTTPSGIDVEAAGVTIDLSGFEIARTGTGGSGIFCGVSAHHCAIKNGSIRGFLNGVNAQSNAGTVSQIAVSACSSAGFFMTGENWQIVGCISHDNTGLGLSAGIGSVIRDVVAKSNGGLHGISAGANSTLVNCEASHQTGNDAIAAANGSSLTNCVAYSNSVTSAISVDGSALTNCAASLNTGTNGIRAGAGSSLTNCVASSNTVTHGINATEASLISCSAKSNNGGTVLCDGITAFGSTLHNCAASSNTGSGTESRGICVTDGSTLVNCAANNNTNSGGATSITGYGIFASDSIVDHCSAYQNKGDGIALQNNCLVNANLANFNGNGGDGAGVHAFGTGNRIENNYVEGNDRGIEVGNPFSPTTPKGNLIIKNSARSNIPNYKIAVDNRYGPIVDITALGAALVNGNSAASTLVSADPWANFSH
jgi:hypothetical protein